MPVPSPEPSGGESKSNHLGLRPQDGMLLDTLRACLYGCRAVAAMGHKVRVAIGDKELAMTNTTSAAALEGFIQKIVRTKVIRPKENFFRKEGRWWAFVYLGGEVGHVPDLVGVRCIVILLYHPFKPIHASKLLALANTWDVARESEIYGEMCQDGLEGEGLALHHKPFADRPFVEETRNSYYDKLSAFESQLRDAIKRNDKKGQLEIGHQLSEIKREIGRLFYKGKLVQPSMREERDRKNALARIETAKRAIRRENALLGQHLSRIRTGEFCSYLPDRPITWER